jgi:hypothetical protein
MLAPVTVTATRCCAGIAGCSEQRHRGHGGAQVGSALKDSPRRHEGHEGREENKKNRRRKQQNKKIVIGSVSFVPFVSFVPSW